MSKKDGKKSENKGSGDKPVIINNDTGTVTQDESDAKMAELGDQGREDFNNREN